MIIDSHQHFWKYDPIKDAWITDEMKVLKQDFLPQHLRPLLQQNSISGCVAVQADQSEAETLFLLELAEQYDFIKGVVGWIDLRAKDLDERLAFFSSYKKLKGFRHIVQAEPQGFLGNDDFIKGVNRLAHYNFTYDLLVKHHQLQDSLYFLDRTQGVQIVIDHIAKPSIKTGEKTHWELNMAAVGSFKNVHCKISGMVTEADWNDWTQQTFEPYLDEVFEIFRPERVMYGSDWPVCLLAADYKSQLNIIQSYIERFSETEKNLVMGENANRFYNL
jgi:L-fuconolactonase